MRISVFVTILVAIGIFLFGLTLMLKEGETKYDVTIDKSEWEDKYDFVDNVQTNIQPIQESLRKIEDEDKGWLDKIGAGFTGIIAAVTFLPRMMIDLSVLGASLITGLGTTFGLPAYIIFACIIILTIWGIFQLIEIFQRWQM